MHAARLRPIARLQVVRARARHLQERPLERTHGVAFPGLVNAHTHVELSSLRGKVPGGRGSEDGGETAGAAAAVRAGLGPGPRKWPRFGLWWWRKTYPWTRQSPCPSGTQR